MSMGEIIQLAPGSGPQPGVPASRSDWSPQAQPEDHLGVLAHTPDPTAYHDAGGRTMIPRSKGVGLSRGFVTSPGIVNVDPGDPVKGTGGITVDMEKITKQSAAVAFDQSGGNPALAWAIAGQHQQVPAAQVAMPQSEARVAPAGQTGYVVPQSTVGGSQVQPTPLPAAMALGGNHAELTTTGVVSNPSVKTGKAQPMPLPETVAVPGQPVVAAPAIHPGVAPLQQAFVAPPQATVPQVPVQQPVAVASQPVPAYQQLGPQPGYQQPIQPAQPDPTQTAMLSALAGITNQLAEMSKVASNGHAPSLDDERAAIVRERGELERQRRELTQDVKVDEAEKQVTEREPLPNGLAVPEDCNLPFLTNPVSKPKVQVVFDLGAGGRHYKRFHHITVSDMWLSMIYDTRHEGDQFIPAVTGEGDPPIVISFPQDNNKQVRAIVPNGCNQRIGCMDIVNFIIIQQPEQTTVPQFDPLQHGQPTHPDASSILGSGVPEEMPYG